MADDSLRVSPTSWSTLGGLSAIVLWSTTVALARSLSEQLGPITAAAAVYLVAGLLGGLRLALHRTPFQHLATLPPRYLLGCGALFVAYTLLLYVALGLAQDRDQTLQVALLNYLWPAFTVLLALPLLRQRASLGLVPGTALALAGVVLVLSPSDGISLAGFLHHWRTNPWAFSAAALAALCWALYSNLARRWAGGLDRGAVEVFLLATGLGLLALRGGITETTLWTPRALTETLTLGALTTVAYVLWERAMRQGQLLLVAVASYFTPGLSTVVSTLYLGVHPGPHLWIGCALLIAGSLISWRSTHPRPCPSLSVPSNPPASRSP